MLTTSLLSRSLDQTSAFAFAQEYTTRLVNALQPAPHVRFRSAQSKARKTTRDEEDIAIAHAAGVNAVVVDRFEGR